MTALATTFDRTALVRLGEESERTKRACERLVSISRVFEAAVRRALPYLVRAKSPVTALPPKPGLYTDLVASLAMPRHATTISLGPRTSGGIILDGLGVARVLDGVLGGRGVVAKLEESGLTAAQIALASRVAKGLVGAFDEALARIDIRIEAVPGSLPEGALFVMQTIRIGEGETAGHISIILPASALLTAPRLALVQTNQPRTTAAVSEAEVDVVAELARVPIALSRLASLKVGDVLRLPLSIDAPARIQVGGRTVHVGRPTTVGAQVAITICGHGD